ncbi:MAG: TetR/AcrR family transcriptional regulator, partial [bacterium]|nr:TetR/AcrR family transcriptional regulator [bacterium]
MNLRERKKKNTLESIVLAARLLFTTQGYKTTTMGEIAEASDVAVGTLYNYFKSKGEIMLAIASEDSADILKPLDIADFDSMSVEDFLWQFTEKMINFISHYPKQLLNELIGIFWVSGQEN